MNAIVALVHFCEVEGPSVIFCTQAFHNNNSEELMDCSHSDSSGEPSLSPKKVDSPEIVKENFHKKDFQYSNRSAPSTCASCALLASPAAWGAC